MSDAEVLALMHVVFPTGSETSHQTIRSLTAEEIRLRLRKCSLSEIDCELAAEHWERFKSESVFVDLLASIDTWLSTYVGQIQPDFPIWDDLFDHGDSGRYLYLYSAALAVDRVSIYLDVIGVDDEVKTDTLAIVSRHVNIYKAKWGELGTDAGWWLLLMLRGVLLQCGSLQFHRLELGRGVLAPSPWYEDAEIEMRGEGFRFEDEAFGLHIPQGTDLSPGAVESSLQRARSLFEKIWPSDKVRLFTLQSWLLDPQLQRFLASTSNIVQLQGRFELLDNAPVADDDILEFVFRRPGVAMAQLPRSSSLERGVLTLLESGGHWHANAGWLK